MVQALPAAAGDTSGSAVSAGTAGDRGGRWGPAIAENARGRERTARRERAPRAPPPARGSRARHADAWELSRPRPRGGRRHRGWAAAQGRSGCCHRGASSPRAGGGGGYGPRPQQESSLAVRRHFRQLRAPTLLTVVCAVSQPRSAAARAGPGRGNPPPPRTQAQRARRSGPGSETLLQPPRSHPAPPRATPPLLPSTLLPPPAVSCTSLPGSAPPRPGCAHAFSRGVNPVASRAPGSL